MEENPIRLLIWLFQSIKSPVIAHFSFLVGLNAQPYLTLANIWGKPTIGLYGGVQNVSGFYMLFMDKKEPNYWVF